MNGVKVIDDLKKIVIELRKLLKGVKWEDGIYNLEIVKWKIGLL